MLPSSDVMTDTSAPDASAVGMTQAFDQEVLGATSRKIRVAFISIFYPVFMGRYLLEALRRRPDVELWTAGPYTARWIPWAGGMHLPETYVFRPDHPLPAGTPCEVPYPQLQHSVPWEPDLWLEVNSTLRAIGRPKGGTYAIVGTDPHVLDYGPERQRADIFFGMQKPYLRPGDRWLPYGYDPVWHSPTTVPAAERKYDAALLGLHYPQRTELVRILRGSGLQVRYELGPAYEDARAIYHQARVGLNWSSLKDTTARVFEVMAFGIAPVLNRVPDLMEMFQDGVEFVGFNSDDMTGAMNAAIGLARDPDRCDALGKAARFAVEQHHSWDHRIQTLLKEVGLVG